MLLRRIHTRLSYEDQLATAHYRSLENFYRARLQNVTTLYQGQLEALNGIDRRIHNLTLTREVMTRYLSTLDARIRKHSDALGVYEDKVSRGDSVRKKQNSYLQAKMNATKREIEATVHVIDMLGVPTTIGQSLRAALNQAYRQPLGTPILPVPKVSNVTINIPHNVTQRKSSEKKASAKPKKRPPSKAAKSKVAPSPKMCPCDNTTAANATTAGTKAAGPSNSTVMMNSTSTTKEASGITSPKGSAQPLKPPASVKPVAQQAPKGKAEGANLTKAGKPSPESKVPAAMPKHVQKAMTASVHSDQAFLEVSTKAYEDLDPLRILLRMVYENLHAYLRLLMAEDAQRDNDWAGGRSFYGNFSARHRFHINHLESTRVPNQKKLNVTIKALAEAPKTRWFVERKAKKLGSLLERYRNTLQSLKENFEMQQHYRALQLQTTEKLIQLVQSHAGDVTFKVKDVEDLMKQAEPVFGGKPVLGLKVMEDEEDDEHRHEITASRSLPKDSDNVQIKEGRIGNGAGSAFN